MKKLLMLILWVLMAVAMGYGAFMPYTGPRAGGAEEIIIRVGFALITIIALMMAGAWVLPVRYARR